MSKTKILIDWGLLTLSLFPSIRIGETLGILEQFLFRNGLLDEVIEEYIELTRLCVKQNNFMYNETNLKQKHVLTLLICDTGTLTTCLP